MTCSSRVDSNPIWRKSNTQKKGWWVGKEKYTLVVWTRNQPYSVHFRRLADLSNNKRVRTKLVLFQKQTSDSHTRGSVQCTCPTWVLCRTWSHRRWNSLWHRLRIGRFVFAHFFCRKREKKSFCSKKCAIKRAGLDLAINSRYCYTRSWISASHTGLLLIPIHNLNIELCIHALRSRICTILYTDLVVGT